MLELILLTFILVIQAVPINNGLNSHGYKQLVVQSDNNYLNHANIFFSHDSNKKEFVLISPNGKSDMLEYRPQRQTLNPSSDTMKKFTVDDLWVQLEYNPSNTANVEFDESGLLIINGAYDGLWACLNHEISDDPKDDFYEMIYHRESIIEDCEPIRLAIDDCHSRQSHVSRNQFKEREEIGFKTKNNNQKLLIIDRFSQFGIKPFSSKGYKISTSIWISLLINFVAFIF
ncbi:hypothetical protein DAMA08_017670 [Martiniozyma asiatica (nom. inval.)]|nr:hypothetical protein DAMA08_017670 [Martiniozyma asiatica]